MYLDIINIYNSLIDSVDFYSETWNVDKGMKIFQEITYIVYTLAQATLLSHFVWSTKFFHILFQNRKMWGIEK